ncbi:ABZJ_00895 family protein [Roseovarius sp. SCSIO 43702]|uniref:ABZJ_00895 family protein n=1 Tax=Roseovarius sp. SCSIO 43702 TaxID=2823043 RepID=UPI001C736B5B|nr:ABZJ_00895 family protein [Roseovarius sp. SCSIO 43702]QYX58274.1 ABZJ_00895 family protein [Roseovarius sp. SCSIO 43702]
MAWPLRYALVFLAAALVIGLSVRAMGSEVVGLMVTLHLMVPAMIAALVEGRQAARILGAVPPRAALWRFALVASVIALALALSLGHLAGRAAPAFATLVGSPDAARLLAGCIIGYLLCNRFLFALGAKNHLDRMKQDGEGE